MQTSGAPQERHGTEATATLLDELITGSAI
jgi:hypothetical protein